MSTQYFVVQRAPFELGALIVLMWYTDLHSLLWMKSRRDVENFF